MMSHLTTHFNSLATIGQNQIIFDDFNQPIGYEFVPSPLVELQSIKCYKEPLGDQESGKPNQIIITDKLVVALCGYFPQIRVEDDIQINERIYNITGVISDDTDTITFLNIQIVNPLEVPTIP